MEKEEIKIPVRYYTPELEEFHYGFRYEFKHPDSPEWIEYNTPEFNPEREDCISRNTACDLRVKHLDSDDFKECGFEPIIMTYGDRFMFQKSFNQFGKIKGCRIVYIPQTNWVLMFRDRGMFGDTMFAGEVKNISELKRILKQTNVTPKN